MRSVLCPFCHAHTNWTFRWLYNTVRRYQREPNTEPGNVQFSTSVACVCVEEQNQDTREYIIRVCTYSFAVVSVVAIVALVASSTALWLQCFQSEKFNCKISVHHYRNFARLFCSFCSFFFCCFLVVFFFSSLSIRISVWKTVHTTSYCNSHTRAHRESNRKTEQDFELPLIEL